MENSVNQWFNGYYFETVDTSTIILYINITKWNSLFQKKRVLRLEYSITVIDFILKQQLQPHNYIYKILLSRILCFKKVISTIQDISSDYILQILLDQSSILP